MPYPNVLATDLTEDLGTVPGLSLSDVRDWSGNCIKLAGDVCKSGNLSTRGRCDQLACARSKAFKRVVRSRLTNTPTRKTAPATVTST